MTDTEYQQSCQERNDWFLKVNGREMTYEDVIKSWGGRMVGESINSPVQKDTDGGDLQVKQQT